jgi:hypothetical protein
VAGSRGRQKAGATGPGLHCRHLERHPEDTGAWFALVAGADEEQLQQLLTLAGRLYGFEELGAGPGAELFRPGIFLIADGLMQELVRHPGQGWELVGPALRSPVIRNRHFALRALSSCPPELLGDEQRLALEQVARDDPDNEIREGAGRLLRGEPLEMA